ncbi:MAG: hypothetical protein CVV49_21205 [Spirochaetae bacterium HGW-Spirochaetae-5]|nr:MAG: hypothetical protein CVV49_21205 [Spirochaetae bacterium HGW-Spirochaetae-5]
MNSNQDKDSLHNLKLQSAIIQILVYTPIIYWFDNDPLNILIPIGYFILSFVKKSFIRKNIENIISFIEILISIILIFYLIMSSPSSFLYILENSLIWLISSISMFFSGIVSLLRNNNKFHNIINGLNSKSLGKIFLLYYCKKELKNIHKTIPLTNNDKKNIMIQITITRQIVKALFIVICFIAVIFGPGLLFLRERQGFVLFAFSWLVLFLFFISYHVHFFNRLSSLKKDLKSNNKSVIHEIVQEKFVRVFKPEDVGHYLSMLENNFMVMPNIFDMFNINDILHLEYLPASGVVLNFYRSESSEKGVGNDLKNNGIEIHDPAGINQANRRYYNEAGCYSTIVSGAIIFYIVMISDKFLIKPERITAGEYIFLDIIIIILLFFLNQTLNSYKKSQMYD